MQKESIEMQEKAQKTGNWKLQKLRCSPKLGWQKREIQEERMKINSEVVGKKQYTNTIETHLMGGDLLEDQLQT